MSIGTRFTLAVALAGIVGSPALAQRGQPPSTSRTPTRPDTSRKAAQPPAAVALDFQDQELRVVLDAIAAAGQLNVAFSNIPSKRVTLHLGKAVARESMGDLLKSYAESQELKVTMSPTLIQVAGPAPDTNRQQSAQQQSLAQQLLQQNQAQQVRLWTLRLKHASAVQLAPVLSNLFSGYSGGATNFGGRGNTTIVPNNQGGFSVIGDRITTPAAPPGNVTTFTPNAGQANVNPNPGRGGGGGGAPGRGGGGAAALAEQLATRLQQASGALSAQASEIRIIAEESSNSLLVRATEPDFQLVQQVVQGVDLRPLQVLVEVTIAQVQRTHDLDLGISGNEVNRVPSGKAVADATLTIPTSGSARDFILQLVGGNGTIRYDVALAALQARGDVRVLSLPVIIAQNNRQAVLNVGSSRPFVQVSQTVPNDPTGRVQTVQYIDVATVLTITPTINPDGYVNLQVTQTDNSATNEIAFDAPVINKREATTQVFIRDGQTTVIGGLADNAKSHDVSGIPLLSRIPFIGSWLFGRTTKSETASELFLFLTPHIISSDEDIDRYRDAVRDGSSLLKQLNLNPRIVPRSDTLESNPKLDTLKRDSLQTMRRRPPYGGY
jgi:type II secretory pathway component GspD/PulD (secretin)